MAKKKSLDMLQMNSLDMLKIHALDMLKINSLDIVNKPYVYIWRQDVYVKINIIYIGKTRGMQDKMEVDPFIA